MARDIDRIISQVKALLPESKVVQEPAHGHPAYYDNGIWYFSWPGASSDVQLESTSGECPFLVETNEQCCKEALKASTVDQAVQWIVEYLSTAAEGRSVRLDGERYWLNPES
jgi:hypothetical protein